MVDAVSSASASNSVLQNALASQQKSVANDTAKQTNSTTAQGLTGDFNTFLKVLITQLKNQDPLAATDVNEFTRELVQFSGVEQQINTNKKLDALISASSTTGMTPLLGYVGKYVEAPANGKIALQEGSAQMAYTLPSEAQSVKVTITNSSGQTVATMDGPVTSGFHRLTWDGRSALGGTAADGVYNMKILATSQTGQVVDITDVRVVGKATGVQTSADGGAVISLGGIETANDDVKAVYVSQPAA